jgi:hypothetical protein
MGEAQRRQAIGLMPGQQAVNMSTPDQWETVKCECGGEHWDAVFVNKRLSPMIAKDGREHRIAYEVLICHKCGKEGNTLHRGPVPR